MSKYLTNLRSRHLSGKTGGMTSVCSTHRSVLEAAIEEAITRGHALLVEATSNQVNQFGGYTGMEPSRFVDNVRTLAAKAGFPLKRLVIGADHLGPYPWKNMPAAQAMQRATTLVQACVKAGFEKIHIDTGMGCVDDKKAILPLEMIAERSVSLCRAAEQEAHRQSAVRELPFYVIGAEIPLPGGGIEDTDQLRVTPTEDVALMIEAMEACFRRYDLAHAWKRVVAVVVQPGVDFGDTHIARYQPEKAAELSAYHVALPGNLTYEVHATDYQSPEAIERMVRSHFTILKVGPCLTNAYREAIFALSHIETEWLEKKRGCRLSEIRYILESAMKSNPEHWQSYYRGNTAEVGLMRRYSYRDRIRYYWGCPEVVESVDRLLRNLNRPIPRMLISQYFPDLYPAVDVGEIDPAAPSLIKWRIRRTLAPYVKACSQLVV